MTTTEERLAALQTRRAAQRIPTASDAAPAPTSTLEHTPATPPRRRSPAASSKILVTGASVTAVLGTIAAMGLADRSANADAEPGDAATSPPSSAQHSIPAPPQAPSTTPTTGATSVVVIVDQNGTLLTTATLDPASSRTAIITVDVGASPGGTVASVASDPPAAAEPIPVPTPSVVEVAVPAPPRPQARPQPQRSSQASPAPQAAPAPQPQPQPEATTHGS